MINKIKALAVKYRELILYIFFGGMTTVVDFVVFWIFTRPIQLEKVPAQIISIAAAIVFAYIVNKKFVFSDKSSSFSGALKQFISFASMRVLSGAFQTFALWLFSDILKLYDMAVKLAAAVIVVILNYIFSKLIIFRKNKKS